jgi:signal transduction histidine kinase/CheY-like chemotaxis protein
MEGTVVYKKLTKNELVDIYNENGICIIVFEDNGSIISCDEFFNINFLKKIADQKESVSIFDIIIGLKSFVQNQSKLQNHPDIVVLKIKKTTTQFIFIKVISFKKEQSKNTFIFKIEKDQKDIFKDDLFVEKNALKQLLDCTTQPVFIKNNRREFIYVNKSFCVHFEMNCKKILGKTHEEIFPDSKTIAFVKSTDMKVIQDQEDVEIPEYIHTKRNGEEVSLFCLKTPFVRSENSTYLLGILIETARRKKAEHLAKAKSDFLSAMSHELRTPLNSVVGVANLLMDSKPRKDQLEYLNVLKFSSENLLAIISNILDFDKIDSGKIDLEIISTDIHEFMNKIRNLHAFKAEEKGIYLQLSLPTNLTDKIYCDPTRLSQIINNLVNNAIKYTEKGGVKIKVVTKEMEDDKVEIIFSIVDSGIGIPANKQDAIFDPFIQASTDTTRIYGGSGLGLSITKKLVEIMGGEITLKSQEKKGSTFTFKLISKINKEKVKGHQKKTIQNKKTLLTGLKILLVEDNLLNVFIVNKFLTRWGGEAELASDGYEAIEKIQSNDYNIVLMDLHMPGIDGFITTERIRKLPEEKYQKLPILALTADALTDIKEKALKNGFNDLISKPFYPDELLQKITLYTFANKVLP